MTIDVLSKAIDASPKRSASILNALADRNATATMPTTFVRPPVRRSLFGPVDHEQSMQFLQRELKSISDSQRAKWNFDFTSGEPLNDDNGNFEWQPVRSEDAVPVAYALSGSPYLHANAESTVAPVADAPSSITTGCCTVSSTTTISKNDTSSRNEVEAQNCARLYRERVTRRLKQTSIKST